MENIKPKRRHAITIDGRQNGSVTGVEKVVSSNDTMLILITSEGGLTIVGKELKIVKYNEEDGALSFFGKIDGIKYSVTKPPLLKRIFK